MSPSFVRSIVHLSTKLGQFSFFKDIGILKYYYYIIIDKFKNIGGQISFCLNSTRIFRLFFSYGKYGYYYFVEKKKSSADGISVNRLSTIIYSLESANSFDIWINTS